MSEEIRDETIEGPETDTGRPPNRIPFIVAALAIGALVIGGLAFWYFRGSDDDAGKPLPTPQTVTFGDNTGQASQIAAEQTITLQPEQAEKIGLKTEIVGETLSTEAVSVAATGVVQPNAYKETPVIALLGGVLRSVSGELGQTVGKGQTVAVIFSDELAASQSRFLALQTEAQTARQNYDRMAKLVKISPVSNAELDRALTALKTAEADIEEHHNHHDRAEKLLNIGAISREEYEQALAKLKIGEANLDLAEKQYDRAVKVAEINPLSRGEFEQAAVKRQTAESDLATARQRLLLFGMSPQRLNSLRAPSQITSEIALTAPVSGTITKRDANIGQVVEANKDLMRVTDLSSVWVIAQVYEKDLSSVRFGMGASVTTDAYPGRLFRGHVAYIDPNINLETRTAQVRVELDNPGQMLKIGMYVNAAFGSSGTAERTMPVIPASAVQNINDKQIAFVATDKPNVFIIKQIRLGAVINGRFTVFEGLNVGDRVVTDGSFLLRAELLKQAPSHH